MNIPIRRTFARRFDAPPPPAEMGSGPLPAAVQTQLFHYTVPPELDIELEVGHLVWVPFGRQMVQGVVVRRSHESPVPTKPIDRLARPQPILTPLQLNLAAWIAEYYVAPLAEAVKLFLPPGLLVKAGAETGARAKRELRVTALVEPADLPVRLMQAGRTTAQAQVLGWFLQHPAAEPTPADLAAACQLKSLSAINTLLAKDVLTRTEQGVRLNMSQADALALLLDVRGVARYAQLMNVLYDQGVALWKSDLYALADADLALLRAMEKDKFVALQEEVRFRDPLAGRSYAKTTAPKLTSEQEHVWAQIAARAFPPHDMPAAQAPDGTMPLSGTAPHQFLLHGVTGSGKTEIYLRAIAQTLANGRQAVVLVPEIALTPQTVARFAGRFPGRVTVIHSDLSAGERYDVWRAVRDGRFDIVVGPRSALFAPLAHLGLIIVDEEHDPSYKQ
ncbi:MAG: DEAD/DEAH box helicase, partial [Caldilineaceae bacterium]|nr:DEAD/DEAH box helicase [Caldilineaceae bacterium]